jgi:hypothetical protein
MVGKVAGIFLILLGATSILIGVNEIRNPNLLTTYAAWTSVGLGVLLVLGGLGHFRAPHKAFLLSLPVLLAFQLQVYCLALFYEIRNVPLFLGAFIVASVLILVLSYRGFSARQTAKGTG